jgi:hypothetical protein
MSSNGQHAPDAAATNRRRLLIVAAIVLALLVFGGGYVLGQSDDDAAAPATTAPGPSVTPSETPTSKPSRSASESESPSATASASANAVATAEPADHLSDGTYFVRLTDIQGGEEGPLQLQYDLAYFLTGAEANQAAADRGLETPVPNDYLIVNDTHKLRLTPLAGTYGVKYIPEGSCCQPVKAHAAQFLEWMGQTNQSDFPPKETSWWRITIEGGEVTQIKQQYLP